MSLQKRNGFSTHQIYVDDSRFAAFYEKYAEGLAVFMRDAMYAYCDARSS
ncbi:MAG: TipAS antibiotic-recognition domain-containing protein [Patescibacteria group bacterium]